MTADCIVVGAGAAGLWCAAVAGQRGRRVVVLDHGEKVAEKIRISGGGRCNFTNRTVTPTHFVSRDPAFCAAALEAFTPADFLRLVRQHGIGFHEKHRGQLFCNESSEDIIRMLRAQCAQGGVTLRHPCRVDDVTYDQGWFRLATSLGVLAAPKLVIATGGLSIPKIGATDFGYRIARQFGLSVIEPRPGLVPLTFEAEAWQRFRSLAGVAAPVGIRCLADTVRFDEDLLFTHRGLSGPAVLQISTYWNPGETLEINLVPKADLENELKRRKEETRQSLLSVLSEWLPKRLAMQWLATQVPQGAELATRRLAEIGHRQLTDVAHALQRWCIHPTGSEGFRRAEVTRGGVATCHLEAATLEAKAVPGLYFIGEVVDVTGWLGGYNFQWAWASGYAAGRAL